MVLGVQGVQQRGWGEEGGWGRGGCLWWLELWEVLATFVFKNIRSPVIKAGSGRKKTGCTAEKFSAQNTVAWSLGSAGEVEGSIAGEEGH